jgi:hypothetical protein
MARPLYSRGKSPVTSWTELGWAPEPVPMLWNKVQFLVPIGSRAPLLLRRSWKQHSNHIRFEVSTALTEEWSFLGYKAPVRTSQETHYFSATESSQLMLCKI